MRQSAALAFTLAFLFLTVNLVGATCVDESDCQNQINQQNAQLTAIQKQQKDLQNQLDSLEKSLNATATQLNDLQANYNDIHSQLLKAEGDLNNAQALLDKNKAIFRARVRDDYIHADTSGWQLIFGGSYSFNEAIEDAGLRVTLMNRNRAAILQYVDVVKNLANTKALIAAADQTAQNQLNQITSLRDAQVYQKSSLKSKLARNAQQAALIGSSLDQLNSQLLAALASKQAGNGKSSLGGAGSFRFYGYGTEHGVGMSQWGGFQLAHDQHKTATQILQFYYSGVAVQPYLATNPGQLGSYSDNTWKISVAGNGQMTYAQYLAGIGETDPEWYNIDASAAAIMDQVQVIAARAYALAYTGGDPNKTICITQSCQVYVGGTGKAGAVSASSNLVITSGGSLVSAYYFSTSGPHTDCIYDTPSFGYNSGSYDARNCSSSGVYQRVNYSDTMSPFNNWSGIISNSWSNWSPPNSGYTGGTPLTNADLELILNAGLLKLTQCPNNSGVYVRCPNPSNLPSLDQVKQWLTEEGTTPINGVTGIGLIRMSTIGHDSSDRVAWVTATGSNRSITQGQMSGIRFRWVYNVLSPEKDWLPSTWFYVR